MSIREKLVAAGVRNLREFGYKECDKDSIMTDEIYKKFFLRMLEDNKGLGADNEIDQLIADISQSP